MELYDEEKIKKQNKMESKLNKIIISAIIIVSIIVVALIILIYYLVNNPNKITYKLNGKVISSLEKVLELKENEDGTVSIHAPIKTFAEVVGYKASNGEYNSASTKWNVCNVENSDNVSEFYLDSISIRKKDLTVSNSEYETYDISEKVYEKDQILYTNEEGLEKGFNLAISYDQKKKVVDIYTLDVLVDGAEKRAINNFKVLGMDNQNFANKLAILDNMIVVTSTKIEGNAESGIKYGVLEFNSGKTILETKYDKIIYIPSKKEFFIYMNEKVGIINTEGEILIDAVFDDLTLIDKEDELYMAKRGGLYGVINGKGEIVVHLEYSQVGIDATEFKDNGVKTGYVLLNTLIPVRRSNKWGFFDKKGNKVTELIYEQIGCQSGGGTAEYSLAIIPNYNYILVRKGSEFTFIDLKGKELVNNIITSAYIRISSGEPVYYMRIKDKDKEYNVIDVLSKGEKAGLLGE